MKTQRLLLFSLLLVLLFAACTLAQNDNEEDVTTTRRNNPRPPAATTADEPEDEPTATAAPPSDDDNNDDDDEEESDPETTTSRPNLPRPTTARTTTTPVVITRTGTETLSENTDLPVASGDIPLPKASDDREYKIPVITPPPTGGAPFMQQSNLPEGTVFIAAGSALAICALIILAWRGLVAWSLHRSVKRANHKPGIIDSKSMLRPHKGGQGGGFYAAGAGSMHSLDHLASTNRSPGAPPPNSSLFFSPTSNTGPPPSAGTIGGDRRSVYLPPGFYSAGNRKSTVPSNSSQTHFGRPMRAPGVSPPGTPLMAPASRRASSSGTERMVSMRINDSQTSLNVPPTGRAPSAYLEDLFESHPIPEQHPSQGGRF